MKTISAAIIAITCIALSGCGGNHYSVFNKERLSKYSSRLISMDAKQRAVLIAPGETVKTKSKDGTEITKTQLRFCAEPSPDVFTAIAQAASANASIGKAVEPESMNAALNAVFSSSEQASTIPRTQTINMLREMMYRTCERYLNGGIDGDELALQAVRDQRLMVSILAIEQLAGAITSKPVEIGASSLADLAEVQEKNNTWKEKQEKHAELDKTAKESCDNKSDNAAACTEAKKKRDEAKEEMDKAEKEVNNAVTAVAKTINGVQSTSAITHIASRIENIVVNTFQQDEFFVVLYQNPEEFRRRRC